MLYQIEDVQKTLIVKRPSASCKTPYVADVIINNENKMAHCPSLGCCGYAEKDCYVISSILKNKKKDAICDFRVELAIHEEKDEKIYIGINPKSAETIAELCLKKNLISNLSSIKSYARETKILNSRFDFTGIDNTGCPFVMEIKNVPLADYVDVIKKERPKAIEKLHNDGIFPKFNEKIAYFPDGYRKKSNEVVSPRALKHIQELEYISLNSKTRAILCFVIQREDVSSFQPSNVDPIYKEAIIKAKNNGVEIKTIQVKWNESGECIFLRNDLPINL